MSINHFVWKKSFESLIKSSLILLIKKISVLCKKKKLQVFNYKILKKLQVIKIYYIFEVKIHTILNIYT
jgi:hypothetical protein